MKRSTWKKRALASALALTMAASVLPMAGFAAGTSGTGTPLADTGDLVMNKTAKLENDGTYTINLEAYATGEVISTVSTTPLDIVLLLDVSGSMEDGNLTLTDENSYASYTGRVVSAAQNTSLRHRCEDGTYSTIRWTTEDRGWGITRYRFYCNHCGASRKHDVFGQGLTATVAADWNLYEPRTTTMTPIEALKYSVNNFIDGVAEKNEALTEPDQRHRVSLVKFAGTEKSEVGNDTYREYGFTYNYTQIVEELTTVDSVGAVNLKDAVDDLVPGGATSVDYGMNRATDALRNSKDGRNKVIILFSDGEPTHTNGFETNVANNAIAKAYQQKNGNVLMYSVAVVDGADPSDTSSKINKFFHGMSSNYPDAQSLSDLGTGGNNGYYKSAADADQLNNIFEEIKEDITTTDVTLDANAVLKDIMAEGFEVPDSAQVTAQVVPCTGRDQNGVYLWGTPQTLNGAQISTLDNKTVTVSGFNYKENCVVTGDFNEDANQYNCTGSKLVVTIKGVEALDEAATGVPVYTNAATSGIYANAGAERPVAVFNRPTTVVNKELYVLDYAKTAVLTNEGQTTRTTLDADGMHKFTATTTQISEKYGKAEITADGLTYTPTKMNWDGYDTFYSFGRNNNGNVWSKISVMPANNVYYEDDFITTEENGGKVGIEYSGDWTVDGTPSGNTETPNNGVHGGWVEGDAGLSDDTGYSDGSAHVSRTKNAKATFTFTGTGVDIYGYTDMTTGTVRAQLYRVGEDGNEVLSKVWIVDTQSESNGYYQIPTLFFSVDYGTYKVVLTVGSTSDNRSTFYLDGIRVYNPIQGDPDVDAAYGNEVGAVFQSVRNILLDSGMLTADVDKANGVVFIDKDESQTETTTNVIGTYEDYGPKNEVYLAKDQSIAFTLDGAEYAYIGLKAPNGATTATVTNGAGISSCDVKHSTDLYYQVTPNENGLVVITNTGSNLLSITKLRVTGEAAVGETSLASLMSYMSIMDTLPEVPYVDAPVEETPDDSESSGNVDIENPDQDQSQETPNQGNSFLDVLKDIFESIWNWF